MRAKDILYFTAVGIRTIVTRRSKPILGTIILTDDCNLSCLHCAVHHRKNVHYPYLDIVGEMERFYAEGIRILFFCGGETMLWQDGDRTVGDLVRVAKRMGFLLVNIVTNGTLGLSVPEADVIFLSLDGMREGHNRIRGNTFDRIMEQAARAPGGNICVYMAINRLNRGEVEELARFVRDHPALNSISFNFHTPYAGTEELALSREETVETVGVIKRLIREGYPVFNLYSALDHFIAGSWSRPCGMCIVSENNRRYVCGRCIEEEGLCERCGYLFAVEFSLLFRGNLPVIIDVVRTYLKYA
ncbi:radical SAM protein [Gorillibacterium timonense]|uniref:radical SAM protein n=1 Tax=Gorillibacterium timonense TaxID=1689269 RepID=UPI00071D15A8|nr:radical SAM protein [Gorillibacterium timonense]